MYWANVERGARSTAYHTHERTDEWSSFCPVMQLRVWVTSASRLDRTILNGHAVGSAPHVMEALDDMAYLMGGQIDSEDLVIHPEAGLIRARGTLRPVGEDDMREWRA